ncbi:hypothetical protein [Pseudaminobacter soli (ex Li et al. 2025)]|uniref:BA14K family protein n=1 Tax=Pseudaminobacter soli (ex Li et al. 2025) TaxID=1295366 RepID=A0A2P7SNH5_9HYPH|nr:hypothetical protein [Mesorhizobium soli]PSJ64046.1 hypothetical protein C7I85_02755 [Mesorhizobium soli]
MKKLIIPFAALLVASSASLAMAQDYNSRMGDAAPPVNVVRPPANYGISGTRGLGAYGPHRHYGVRGVHHGAYVPYHRSYGIGRVVHHRVYGPRHYGFGAYGPRYYGIGAYGSRYYGFGAYGAPRYYGIGAGYGMGGGGAVGFGGFATTTRNMRGGDAAPSSVIVNPQSVEISR